MNIYQDRERERVQEKKYPSTKRLKLSTLKTEKLKSHKDN